MLNTNPFFAAEAGLVTAKTMNSVSCSFWKAEIVPEKFFPACPSFQCTTDPIGKPLNLGQDSESLNEQAPPSIAPNATKEAASSRVGSVANAIKRLSRSCVLRHQLPSQMRVAAHCGRELSSPSSQAEMLFDEMYCRASNFMSSVSSLCLQECAQPLRSKPSESSRLRSFIKTLA